jgi:hypothetical protein
MPNDCENIITVRGPVSEVGRFRKEVATKDTDVFPDGRILDANKILPCPDDEEDPEKWCRENWGTKWPGYDASPEQYEVLPNGNAELCLRFYTAWGPYSSGLYEILSRRFPKLDILCLYIERGWGFTGTLSILNGKIAETYTGKLKPCHYGKLQAQGDGVWIVVDRNEVAAVIEGPEENLPVLSHLWGEEQDGWWEWKELPPLPEKIERQFEEKAIGFGCYWNGSPTDEDVRALHTRLARIRQLVVNPSQAEAIEFLAHAEADVRNYARKQWKDWRDMWVAEASIKSIGPEIEKENAVIKKKPVRSRKPKR